jgi:hypothetical protein
VTTKNRLSGPRASSRVYAKRESMPPGMEGMPWNVDVGRWRHPVYGNRNRWVEQRTRPGWFSRVADEHGLRARQEVIEAVERVAKQLGGRGA